MSQPASLKRRASCILDNSLDQMQGGDPDVIGLLARLGIREVGDLTQWTKLDVRIWIPNINAWDGLPHGILSLELPQVGRILKVGQAWIAYDSKGRQA